MRLIQFFLVGCLILPLGACAASGQGSPHPAPAPVKRELLIGRWAATDPSQFVQGFEFSKDGSLKTVFKAMTEPVPGRYSWTDDRTIVLEFQPTEAARKAFQKVARAHRDSVKKAVEWKAGPERAEQAAAVYPLELSERETWNIGLAENQLFLTNDKDVRLSFDPK
jgi:hypothetical protein